MKKILCIFLSIVMALSVATVAFAAEEEEQRDLSEILAEKNIDEDFINAFNGKTLDFPSNFKNNASYYSGGSYNVTNIIRSGAISQTICMTQARTTEGTAPVIRVKRTTVGMPSRAVSLRRLPSSREMRPSRMETCMPEIATMWAMPDTERSFFSA